MSKYIVAVWNKEIPKLPLPKEWEVCQAENFAEGMVKVKELAPSILMFPESQDGHDGFEFLKEVEKNIGVIPPSIIWGFSPGNLPTDEELDLFGILSAMEGDPKFKEILKVLEPFFVEPPLPQMTIPEFLASLVSDERTGVYQSRMGDFEYKLVVKNGQLQAALDEGFRNSYRDYLAQGGIEPPEFFPDIASDISGIDSLSFLDQKKLAGIKMLAFSVFFDGLPVSQETRFLKKAAENIKGAFVAVDIFPLLRKLVERIPLADIGLLQKCSFRKNMETLTQNRGISLLPDEGFILHTLDTFLSYEEIKKTIVSISESQLLRKIYLLFILGLLESNPKGGVPQRISYLKQEIETDEKRVNSQSIAIEQFSEILGIPGLSPYRVLGVKENVGLQEASESFKSLETLFDVSKLHPNIRKKYVQHLTIIHGKLAEALLLLEASYLDGKQKEKVKLGEDLKFVARIGEAKTDVQKVTDNRQKEAEKLYAQAKEFQENDLPYEAGQYLKTALVYNPFSAPVHHLLAQVYLKTGGARSKHVAEKEYRMAVENDPWNVRYLLDLSKLYIEENMPNRARSLLEQASRIDPKSIEIRDMKELARKAELKKR
jgi:hypothetical protein